MISLPTTLSDLKYLLLICAHLYACMYISMYVDIHTLLLASRHIIKLWYCCEVWNSLRCRGLAFIAYCITYTVRDWNRHACCSPRWKRGASSLLIENKSPSMDSREGLTLYVLLLPGIHTSTITCAWAVLGRSYT